MTIIKHFPFMVVRNWYALKITIKLVWQWHRLHRQLRRSPLANSQIKPPPLNSVLLGCRHVFSFANRRDAWQQRQLEREHFFRLWKEINNLPGGCIVCTPNAQRILDAAVTRLIRQAMPGFQVAPLSGCPLSLRDTFLLWLEHGGGEVKAATRSSLAISADLVRRGLIKQRHPLLQEQKRRLTTEFQRCDRELLLKVDRFRRFEIEAESKSIELSLFSMCRAMLKALKS